MSGSSTSQDLPIALLPLTLQQRDEIDSRVLLKGQDQSPILKIISEDKEDTTSYLLDYMLVSIMERTLLAASRLLKRKHLKDILTWTWHRRKHCRNTLNYGKSSATPSLETQKYLKYTKLAIPCGRLTARDFYLVTSTVTSQPLVDKMIPIYFDDSALDSDDLNRVSQMFISDKKGKNCHEHDLGLVTCTHDSIQCLSNIPYIALVLDLNVKPKFNATFPEKELNHTETNRCLRIYASGISKTTFPFSSQHPEVASQLLRGLVSRQKETPSQTTLEALVKFGSTDRLLRNLQWELQDA
ncbi:uncharacterized protein F5891DRAFT_1180453 [Suillus fuscotomentosus]|uniref:Uncharacterized protein n=1 Tax=Suillus fuscotomentosus TaxID=1912939 RepID=A0AAD4EMF2_9AGAM|nr:uncharacterized protein F5891DRAFT_1180453 [Suillus fuscotomentosus]KAG1908888.1 hypothetical protein F5891DRAFT_1180453 [Suillus fuscotomentosus]